MSKSEHTSPPAGTGNLPGLGEAFSINLSTGTGTYSYQIALPDGVARFTPKLVLEYAHGNGHGSFGLGWRLPLRSIGAALDFGVPTEDGDPGLGQRFLDTGSEIVPSGDGTFRALRETLFARYARDGAGWRIEERNGTVHKLGMDASARVADPDHDARVVEWLLESSVDPSGNEIRYRYLLDGGFAYPSTIRYAAYEVRFAHERRPDVRLDGRSGFLRRRALRCASIELVLDPGAGERLIRTWTLGYGIAGSGVSLLTSVGVRSHGSAPDGSLDVVRPTARFAYTGFEPNRLRPSFIASEAGPPPPLTDPDVALVTLDDAPLPGVLVNRAGRQYHWRQGAAGDWAPPQPIGRAPLAPSFARAGLAFIDMDGSGTADLVVANEGSPQGYYQNAGSDGWGRFVAVPPTRRRTPTWSDPTLRLTDADGDGLVDAIADGRRGFVWWRNEGATGWSEPSLVPKRDPSLVGVDLAGADVHFADMTGDGLADLVRVRSGRVEFWPNLGRGRFGPAIVMTGAPRLGRNGDPATILLADVDGDGCADLLEIGARGVTLWPNRNGASFGSPITIRDVPTPIPGTVRVVNMTGAASAGLLWNSRTGRGTEYVSFAAPVAPPYLLERIENGAGLTSEIRYRSAVDDFRRDVGSGERWTTNFPFPYLVVAGTRETDAVSGRVVAVEYRYHEAHFERSSRRFEGFRRTERIEKGDATRADSRQVHHFLMAQERGPGHGPEHAALNGLLARIETFGDDGSPSATRPYRVESCDHELTVLDNLPDGRARAFVSMRLHRDEDSERTDDVRIEEKTYDYDAFGNAIREVRRGFGTRAGVPQPIQELTVEITFAASAARYLVDKPARITVRNGGALVSEKRLFYDGPDFVGLALGVVERGLVTRESEWVETRAALDARYAGMDATALGFTSDLDADGMPSMFAHTRRTRYDGRGLATATQDPLGRIIEQTYDASGLFRTGLTDALGHTTFIYDRANGQITTISYPDGSVTRFAYDAQGRVLRHALPGQDLDHPPQAYAYDESTVPTRRVTRMRLSDGSTVEGVTYYDGYGKEFQQRVPVEPGRFLVSGVKLPNAWGDLAQESEPTFAADAAFAVPALAGPSRRFFYDARGRVVRTLNFNGGVSTAEYLPFRVRTRDADDNDDSPANVAAGQFDTPHDEEFDCFRHLVRVVDSAGGGADVATEYDIGPQGELRAVRDSHGVAFEYTYDRRGCRLEIASREAGTRSIWYDAAKKPVRTRDATGNDIAATWDSNGRLERLVAGATEIERYVYDDPAHGAFGRLAEVRYTGGRQTFDYDPSGNITGRTYEFDGQAGAQTLRFEHDTLGRETAVIHTDGTRIERHLTHNGWVRSIPGILSAVDYDPRGFPTDVHFANGVTTSYGYTPGPGVVSHRRTVAPDGSVLEDIAYDRDLLDLMIGSEDTSAAGAGIRRYTYDPLYQLTSASVVENGIQVVGSYQYAGYNLQRSDEARSTYRYDDAAHPDRLAGLSVDGQPRFDVGYDAGGKITALPGQTLAYDARNQLLSIAFADGRRAAYAYDHQGFRVSKRLDDGQGHVHVTLFLGGRAEVADGVATYVVKLGAARVALLSAGSTRFVHEDPTGSTLFLTNPAGQRIVRVDARPFGNLAPGSADTDHRSFSLHPVDAESGLVYMHRRYYAPTLGRFLTPDLMATFQPEKSLHAPQGLHLYAFVANDPLGKTDPTGLSFWSFVGAVVGVVVGVIAAILIVAAVVATGGLAGVLLGIGLALAAALTVTGVSYIIASNIDPNSAFGQFMRGFMIGFNAGMNAVLATALFGPWVGVGLGVINFLATFDGVAQNSVYQGILGWTSWLMPMSWGATGLGVVVFAINLVAAAVTLNMVSATKIEKLAIDWKTGSIIMEGGLIRNGTAFDMGNFVFIDPGYVVAGDPERSYEALVRHETGHTLSVAAFGSAFHLLDFIGENIVGSGKSDYGEQLAESHAMRPGDAFIPMWG